MVFALTCRESVVYDLGRANSTDGRDPLLDDADNAGHGPDHSTDGRQLGRRSGPDSFGLLPPAQGPPVVTELLPFVLPKVTTQDEAGGVVAAEVNRRTASPVDGAAV